MGQAYENPGAAGFRHVGKTWSESSCWCADCDAPIFNEAILDSCGAVRCSSCLSLLTLEVAAGPMTAYLTRFEPVGPASSRHGDSASGLCPLWLNIATGATQAADQGAFADPRVPMVPCVRQAHDGDAHVWDRRSWRATLAEARGDTLEADAPRQHRASHVEGSRFRALREGLGLTTTVAAARYGRRWGRGGTDSNIRMMERQGGSTKLLRKAADAYGTEMQA